MFEERVEDLSSVIVERPGAVVAVFLVGTVVMASGLSSISTETGTSQFSEGIEAMDALESVNAEFGPVFSSSSSSTQLIQSGQNALSKSSLLELLRMEERLMESGIPVSSISSPAGMVAKGLDPNASGYGDMIRAVESATPSRIDRVVEGLASNPGFTGLVSKDFNRVSASASKVMAVVRHPVSGGSSGGPPGGGGGGLQQVQMRVDRVVDGATVFGQGIVSSETQSVIADSLLIVVPAASLFIVFFLVYAYRDPGDLLLGVLSLVLTVIWTFGFMGLAGIPFSQMLIAVPPLLLAVGIDFGIHAVNRYKEEHLERGAEESMRVALRQLLVAFFMVSGTTVIGFLSNMTSSLPPIRDFGLVAGIGITFTTLVFGVFLPSAKLLLDRKREDLGIPVFGKSPVGSEDSLLGRLLPLTAELGRMPYVSIAVFMVLGGSLAVYGSGVSTSFSQEDFLPPEDIPDVIEGLPEPFAPGDYSATGTLDMIDRHFQGRDSVLIYLEAPMRSGAVVDSIQARSGSVPGSFVTRDGEAEFRSILDVIRSVSGRSDRFRALVKRNDPDGDGVPEENLGEVYDMLFRVAPDSAGQYLSDGYRSAKLSYSVESSASQSEVSEDGKAFAEKFRVDAIATGMTVVFKAVSDMIFSSALKALAISLVFSTAFLVVMYQVVFGKPLLAVANMFPVALTLAFIVGTMRFFEVPLNAMTATILSITIGLGVDYSVHVVDRFEDELEHTGENVFEALRVTLRGTGGALTSSMLTTVSGIGVLVLAITPILGQFGLITGISILYSYIASLVALPPALVLWARWRA